VLTTERWKLFEIHHRGDGIRHLLFDLAADPFELTDVSARQPEVVAQLAAELASAFEQQRQRGNRLRKGEALATGPADPRLREQLEALGYVEDDPSPR
jgi:hypothetical protein